MALSAKRLSELRSINSPITHEEVLSLLDEVVAARAYPLPPALTGQRVGALLRAYDEHRTRGEAFPVNWIAHEIEALRTLAAPAEDTALGVLHALRAEGWTVAVHNDYRLHGVPHTFWLFTKGDRCVKGEGLTDLEALNVIRTTLALPPKTPITCEESSEAKITFRGSGADLATDVVALLTTPKLLKEFTDEFRRKLREVAGDRKSPLPCGCHCTGGCCDPYAPCASPCKDHMPL